MGGALERGIDAILNPVQRGVKTRKTTGWHIIEGKTLTDRAGALLKDVEDLTRFVCSYMNGTPSEYWQMPVFEFYRDVVRAHAIHEAKKKEIEQLKK